MAVVRYNVFGEPLPDPEGFDPAPDPLPPPIPAEPPEKPVTPLELRRIVSGIARHATEASVKLKACEILFKLQERQAKKPKARSTRKAGEYDTDALMEV